MDFRFFIICTHAASEGRKDSKACKISCLLVPENLYKRLFTSKALLLVKITTTHLLTKSISAKNDCFEVHIKIFYESILRTLLPLNIFSSLPHVFTINHSGTSEGQTLTHNFYFLYTVSVFRLHCKKISNRSNAVSNPLLTTPLNKRYMNHFCTKYCMSSESVNSVRFLSHY